MDQSERFWSGVVLLLLPFALWLGVPRYLSHYSNQQDTTLPEELLRRGSQHHQQYVK